MTSLRLNPPPDPGGPVDRSLDDLRALAREGYRQAPLVHSYVADCETPVSAFLKLRGDGPVFLLESAEQAQRVGRYSFIGLRPQSVIRGVDGRLEETTADGTVRRLDESDPFGAVEDAAARVKMAPTAEPLAFSGGVIGYFGYDLVRRVERLPDEPADDRAIPDLVALVTGPVVAFDHLRKSLAIVVPCALDADAGLEASYEEAVAQVREIRAALDGPVPATESRRGPPSLGPVRSNMPREHFEAAVERCREYIFAGDAFQIVPSQRFSAEVDLDPFAVYRGLRAINPSPYMFFLDVGETVLAGSSPEMLVKVQGGLVEMHPIAGSRPRGADEDEDVRLREELLADPKERAEHVMLVDLGRNDLGRVSEVGSVHVASLMDVQPYSHVMHIESSVVGRLAPDRRATDALRATFPAGTLSGAPKVRAMEIIDELEPTKRGPYGGAVGYLGWDGDLDTCITIRTIVFRDGVAHVQAGAGIVADSVPAKEHEETEAKAAALFRAIEVAAAQPDW
ncbi:MAG: anthranilate synthase component I [Miltoncostaeaceae bacterium]